jgi:hypothetical protein
MQKFSLLISLLLITCFSGFTNLGAQRSLYQDALELGAIQPKPPTAVSFEFIRKEEGHSYLPKYFQLNKDIQTYGSFVVEERISLRNSEGNPGDSIFVKIGERRFGLDVGVAPNGLPVNSDENRRAKFRLDVVPEENLIRIFASWSLDSIDYITAELDESDFAYRDFYSIYDDDDYFAKAVRLAAYTEFDVVYDKYDYSISPRLVGEKYDNNPYFNWRNLLPEMKAFSRSTTANSNFTWQIKEEIEKAYPYHLFLNGQSTLKEDIPVSASATEVSYRQRIVTAQSKLDQANASFNKQRKKGGLLDVNTVAVGLSDFIAERAQEELNLTFFNRFKENLAKDSELTLLFPTTRDLLYKFEISNYKVFLAHARETFNTDLNNLGANISDILKLPKYEKLKNDPNVFNLALIYSIAELAYQEKPVEDILLSTHRQLVNRQTNLDESINLAIAERMWQQSYLRPGEEQDTFGNKVLDYLKAVQQQSRLLNTTVAAFAEPTGDPLFNIFKLKVMGSEDLYPFINAEAGSRWGMSVEEKKIWSALSEEEQSMNYALAEELNDKRSFLSGYGLSDGKFASSYHGKPTDDSYLYYSTNLIEANLKGRDYYGYIRPGVVGTLNQDPDAPTEYVATGLERIRTVLQVPFPDYLEKYQETLVDTKEAMEDRERVKNSGADEAFLRSFQSKVLLVAQARELRMKKDLALLQLALGKTYLEDHFLAGLYYQLKYGKSVTSQNPKTFLQQVSSGDFFLPRDSRLAYINDFNLALKEYDTQWQAQLERTLNAHGSKVCTNGTVITLDTLFREVQKDNSWFTDGFENPGKLSVRQMIGKTLRAEDPAYQNAIQEINRLVGQPTKKFYVIDSLLNTFANVGQLKKQREQLLFDLKELEQEADSELVRARENARELAKAVELSAHILFSFRDYSQQYDTLYYLDSQRVEVTVQQTDPKTGMARTYKKDSLVVERTIVPGTTRPLKSARWISRREFDDLRQTPAAWKAFLGLLYERINAMESSPGFSPKNTGILATQFLEIANEIEETKNAIRLKKGTAPRSVGIKDYFPFIRSTVDLFNIVITTPALATDSIQQLNRNKVLGKITEISNETLSLYENIDVREYGNAILNATELLKLITQKEYTVEELKALSKEERHRRAKTQRQVAAIFKYGTFMAEMINAKSSDQVKNILKSTTLPPGSSRIKREVQSSITINSYLGAGLGRDRLLDAPMDIDADAFGAALSVPIGITYSFSPKFLRNRSSFSIHVPLLDLGAITAYRSNPNGQTANVDVLPELEWKSLFSPGAYLIYNFADSPFSLGIGGQYGPQLRELNQANGEPLFLNSWRFPMISATIDVPFYNLHTGPRKIVVK